MSERPGVHLCKDPYLPWRGVFPYDWLNERLIQAGRCGVGPNSTATEVNDLLFDLMAAGKPTTEDRLAWDELRFLDRRLLVDFFMYSLRAAEGDLLDQSLWERPMPLWMYDFLRLADAPPDLAKAITFSSSFDPGPQPQPVPIDPQILPAPPVNIGAVPFNEAMLLKREYDG